jgi:[protein-PII] uridylyltransferase
MFDLSGYKEKLRSLRDEIDRWNKEGVGGHFQVVWYTNNVDRLIKSIFWDIYGKKIPEFSLIALGGYGRKELSLASDIDLLFLWLDEPSEEEMERITGFVHAMWDVGFEFSGSFKGIGEIVESASKDETVKLSLIDMRLIGGSYKPYKKLKLLFDKIYSKDPKDLISLLEGWVENRCEKYGSSVQLIEPNIKESPGGLRDVHTIYWIGKMLYGVEDFKELEKKGLLTTLEFETLKKARDFLWRVRNFLHSIRSRKNDYLDLTIQPEVALSMGYRKVDKFHPALYMMKDLYYHMRSVRKVLKAFLTRVKEEFGIEKDGAAENFVKYIFEERFDKPSKFLLRVYKGLEINVDFDRIYRGFWVPPLYWREQDMYSPEVRDMLIKIANFPESYPAIRFLHETGFLSRLFPEFDAITGLLQLDLYHKYTVDEHTFMAIKNLEELPKKNIPFGEELIRIYKGLLESGEKYRLIIALLFHDIGKGKGRGHSARGMKIAIKYMERLNFSEEDIAYLSFLVRNHTVMAEYAFKRNIYDIGTLSSFVELLGNRRRLDLLYLLTYADLSAVSPNNWDDWKASTLLELYFRACDFLERIRVDADYYEDSYEEVERIMKEKGYTPEEVKRLWEFLPVDRNSCFLPMEIVEVLSGIDRVVNHGESIFVELLREGYEGSFKFIVVKPHKKGSFHKVVGSLTAQGIDIWGANLFECKNGISVYIFELSSVKEKVNFAEVFKNFLEKDSDYIDREVRRVRNRFFRRDIHTDIPTQVTINNAISPKYSIIEVKTRDRIGLLYDISKIFADNDIEIHFVKATTEGIRAIDVFYVTKDNKKLTEMEFLKLQKQLKQKL